jgi:hypothetical protein
MILMQNKIENYSVEITTSTDSEAYTKALAKSMEYAKELITRRMLRDMLWGTRAEGVNEIVHGVAVADSKGSQEPT